MSRMPVAVRQLSIYLLPIFILSGFAGLIYQSIWSQYLGLFLGHSSHAQSLVLMLFMGGMALGAWWASRRSTGWRYPLLAYAAIELLIGILGLVFDWTFQGITGVAYTYLLPGLQGQGATALRWLLATILVLPQCILLGATFPLMSAGYLRAQPQAQGEVLAGLYFANSIGAACGALASTYLLLPALGLPGAVMVAGALNIVVAALIYPLARGGTGYAVNAKADDPASPPRTGEESGRATTRSAPVLAVLSIALLTGATSFVYEITWVRMLSLALGTTLHSFELMLAAFIAGIAFGGLWLRHRADRMASPLRVAGWVQVLMGLAALASMFVYAQAFEWVGWLMRVIVRSADGYGLYSVASAVIAVAVMFPAAFFAGMTLPLLTLALLRDGRGEKVIGQVYAFNTLGAIVGVLAAVHVLMPMLGLKYALLVAAVADIGLGVWLLWPIASREKVAPRTGSRTGAFIAVALGLAGVVVAVSLVRFDPLVLSSSVYRHGGARLHDSAKMLFFKDGQTATVSVFETDRGAGPVRSIATNGKVDAGMTVALDQEPSGDESTMVLLGALPLALGHGVDRVGVIGFGSGLTTHTLLGDPRVGRVDTVEIEPAMVEGARLFGDRVSRAYTDPRSHIVIDDAKAHFAGSGQRYDLIISEPSNPWVGGTASLFSDEFYAFVPRQLNEGGLFVQWLQLYEITPELVSSVLDGLVDHFSDVRAYLANDSDLIIVATPKGRLPELNAGIFDQPALRAELARVGVHGLNDLRDTFAMGDAALRAYPALYPSPRHSDYHPILTLRAPVARFQQGYVGDVESIMTAPWPLTRDWGGPEPRLPRADGSQLNLQVLQRRTTAQLLSQRLQHGADLPGGGDHALADTLRTLGARCELEVTPLETAGLVFFLAGETVPFLSPEEREALWVRPTWRPCPLRDPTVIDALALVSAAASNDHAQVLATGQRLLEGPHSAGLLADARSGYYLFGALQHAAWASGDTRLARALSDRYWDALGPDARASGRLRLLTYMAALGKQDR
ncbi:fused MFS/spermidine synthase [Stenotrophomonas sp. CFBP 13725]|uniref:fused MFS/spermidine synthase n=1 Tax=Stenotrophomonas sp. CFBP 13725 TaxID=2775297 RepID=UPI0017852721|nr:fused MFS/spermidine synthase [Stenotrophomonas sp. CFBP 13725]MBD8636456.1 fused MFS/spermidine synthase [Stenotrophomonas sp. CFBP 13725]